jgi:hypothetical protein
MFNPTQIVITAFIRELREMYDRNYGTLESGFPGVISFVAQLALENIATSDAPYHDVNHTIMVTLVGQEILRGRHISVGGVTPRDWLHFIISLLCHDIGYVRGLCEGDENGRYVSNLTGHKVAVLEGATDASLTPYHVARSKLFIRQRFSNAIIDLDVPQIERNIEHTRFPVPEDESHQSTADYPGLLRAADLIGQLPTSITFESSPPCSTSFARRERARNWGTRALRICETIIPISSGKRSARTSETHCATCGSPRKANNGSPISMLTFSRWSIEPSRPYRGRY